jgi:hypothetical protein
MVRIVCKVTVDLEQRLAVSSSSQTGLHGCETTRNANVNASHEWPGTNGEILSVSQPVLDAWFCDTFEISNYYYNDDGDHHGIRIIIHEALAFDYSAMYVEQLLLVFHLLLGSSSPKRRYICGVQSVSVSCTRTQTLDSTERHVGSG